MRSWARDVEALAPVVEEAEPGTFEHQAMLALRGLATIYVAGMVLALFPEPHATSLLLAVTFNLATGLLAIVYLLIARGLRHLRRWSIAAARPVLLLVVIEDVVLLVSTLAEGRLRLPIASTIAIWALLGPAGVRPLPRPGVFAGLVLLLAAPLLAVLVFARPVFGWGGVLDVHEGDLAAALTVSCGAPDEAGDAGGTPPSLHVTYDWWWSKGTPLPSGLDIVVIGWTGADAQGRALYLLGPIEPPSTGVYQGRRAYPSIEMANAIASTSKGSWQWGVELDEQQGRPGHIEFELIRSRLDQSGAVSERIQVSYVHLGLWHADTAPVICDFQSGSAQP